MNSSKSQDLASSSWPRFRCNSFSSGKSSFPGPSGDTVIWKTTVGKISNEPAIGEDGTIFLPLEPDELVAVSSTGKELWRKSFFAHMKKPLRGITTPAIRSDRSLIVPTFRKVSCLEPDGTIRWDRLIDGLPAAPNISDQGIIYVPAHSVDWIGVYVISPEGEAFGEDDPKLYAGRFFPRNNAVTPAVISQDGNVIVGHQVNITHPEAYTWDPPDEVDEEFSTECVIFTPEGNQIGKVKLKGSGGNPDKFAITHGIDDDILIIGFWFQEIVGFSLNRIINEKRPKKIVKWDAYCNTKKFDWGWYSSNDKDGDEGEIYSRRVRGYPAVDDESKVYVRLTNQDNYSPSNFILQINPTKKVDMPIKVYKYPKDGRKKPRILHETRKILDYNVLKTSRAVEANPIIDSNGHIYLGTTTGKVHVFNSAGEEQRIINAEHPIKYLVIGAKKSLVVATKDNNLICVQ